MNKVREYIILKNDVNHPCLKEINCYDWEDNLMYTDEIHNMLNSLFYMNKLSVEMSYVVAFDHAKNPKGVCRIGHGDQNSTPTSAQNIFIFLMLIGACSFVLVHNHVSDMPNPSKDDNAITNKINMLSNMFGIEFIGHMIINPEGYVIDGGTFGNKNKDKHVEYGEYEDLGNGMVATYIFGERIEGKLEDIKRICE